MRYKIVLSYVGTKFNGWQIQPNKPSIQESLGKAIAIIQQEDCSIVGAGRTDTGVHAKNYVAHFDSSCILDVPLFLHKINGLIHKDIAVHSVEEVAPNFHSRFDALTRTYEYRIHTAKNPFLNERSYYCKANFDIDKMNKASALLLAHKDFQCFSKAKTQVHTYLCHVHEAHWTKLNENEYIFHIKANRFLRNMVRAIVGTLIEVGKEKITVAKVGEILASKNRSNAGKSVPAEGLCLAEITYPQNGK